MARYSTPALDREAVELLVKIISELTAIGIKAELNESSWGVKIPEYTYDITSVNEMSVGHGFSHRPTGKLEVVFRSVHMGMGCLCHAKRFKVDTKDLVQKVVASVKERRDAIIAQRNREEASDKARTAHQRVLKKLSTDFPEFKGNIDHSSGSINLSFRHLSEDEARAIFKVLRDAGIKGNKGFVDDE